MPEARYWSSQAAARPDKSGEWQVPSISSVRADCRTFPKRDGHRHQADAGLSGDKQKPRILRIGGQFRTPSTGRPVPSRAAFKRRPRRGRHAEHPPSPGPDSPPLPPAGRAPVLMRASVMFAATADAIPDLLRQYWHEDLRLARARAALPASCARANATSASPFPPPGGGAVKAGARRRGRHRSAAAACSAPAGSRSGSFRSAPARCFRRAPGAGWWIRRSRVRLPAGGPAPARPGPARRRPGAMLLLSCCWRRIASASSTRPRGRAARSPRSIESQAQIHQGHGDAAAVADGAEGRDRLFAHAQRLVQFALAAADVGETAQGEGGGAALSQLTADLQRLLGGLSRRGEGRR